MELLLFLLKLAAAFLIGSFAAYAWGYFSARGSLAAERDFDEAESRRFAISRAHEGL